MALLSAELCKRLAQAVTSRELGQELIDAIQEGSTAMDAISAGGAFQVIAGLIIATNVSQTIDFAILKVGDQVLMIPATAGSADQIGPIATAGTLGQAAVVGNAYLVLRQLTAPAAKVIVW